MLKKPNEHILSSKLVFMILSAILIILLWNFITVGIQLFTSQTQISNLHKDLEDLQNRQGMLSTMEHFFQSDYFAEREARLKYGLQKKGEQAVIIQDGERESMNSGVQGDGPNAASPNDTPSIRWQWWKYFFGND